MKYETYFFVDNRELGLNGKCLSCDTDIEKCKFTLDEYNECCDECYEELGLDGECLSCGTYVGDCDFTLDEYKECCDECYKVMSK